MGFVRGVRDKAASSTGPVPRPPAPGAHLPGGLHAWTPPGGTAPGGAPRLALPHPSKDMVTSFTQCLAPRAFTASAVPAYGHLPPSSCSWPTVTSTPLSTLAASTGAMQHRLGEGSVLDQAAGAQAAKGWGLLAVPPHLGQPHLLRQPQVFPGRCLRATGHLREAQGPQVLPGSPLGHDPVSQHPLQANIGYPSQVGCTQGL